MSRQHRVSYRRARAVFVYTVMAVLLASCVFPLILDLLEVGHP